MSIGLARLIGLAVVLAGMTSFFALACPPQDDRPPPKAADNLLLPKDENDIKTGITKCVECHKYTYPIDPMNNLYAKSFKSHEFVLLGEGRSWKQDDPHALAHRVLSSELGKQMSTILQDSKILVTDVSKAPQCLTCHAIDVTPAETSLARKNFETEDGVTCNVCHGIRKAWQNDHVDEARIDGKKWIPWRIATPQAKEEAGMRNLRDPVVKAQLCASCHVGSAAEGRVVTHDMYAAGHPPLPPFELATFMESQPKHWGYPTDPALKYFTPDAFKAYAGEAFAAKHPNWTWELYRFHANEVYLARQLAAGAVATLQAEMRMIAADARKVAAVDPKDRSEGVDFARFDCYACHHDLKVPSDRQARGYAGKPGRPPLKAWIGALPGVVIAHAETIPALAPAAKDFKTKWEAVQTAALARPFGDPVELAKAAVGLADWCECFLQASGAGGKPVYTKDEAEKLLKAIEQAAVSPKWTADPEAAMHLTWAYVTLRDHMGSPIAAKQLAALGETITTRVRIPPYSENGEPVPAGAQIGRRQDLFRKYESKTFTDAFKNVLVK